MFVVTAAPDAMFVKGWDLAQAASISSAAAVAISHLGMMAVCGKNFDSQRWPTSSLPSRRIISNAPNLLMTHSCCFAAHTYAYSRREMRRC